MDQMPEIKTKTPTYLRVLKAVLIITVVGSVIGGVVMFVMKEQWSTIFNIFG